MFGQLLQVSGFGTLCAVVACGGAALLLRQAACPDSFASDWVMKRHASLRVGLAFVRAEISAGQVLGFQAGALLVGLVGLGAGFPALGLCLLGALLPPVLLERARRERVRKIESQVEGWLAGLSRALESAPSLGEAIQVSETMCDAPLREEIGLITREMQLGRSLERALSAFEERARSRTLTLALSTLRVGRSTGGDLPRVLRTASASLRELARLEGVIRAKTAEGRAQAWVISCVPVPLYFGIQLSDPDYFRPLEETVTGHILLGVAVLLWILAGFFARQILAVRI